MSELEEDRHARLGSEMADTVWRILPRVRSMATSVALQIAHTTAESPDELRHSDVFAAAFLTRMAELDFQDRPVKCLVTRGRIGA